MAQPLWTAVDDYLDDLFAPEDHALAAAVQTAAESGLPQIQVTPSQGKMLAVFALAVGARKILEIGSLAGYSTIWLARTLPAGGRIVTLEVDQTHAAITRASLERAGLSGSAEVRIGPALESLPLLVQEQAGPFDMVFIDADKINYVHYLEWSLRLTRPGSVIVADNVIRDGAVLDPNATDESAVGARRFNAALAAERRVMASAVQTVGRKGYDGYAVAVVLGG